MRLRGIRNLYREIQSDLRPTYCALVFATLANQSQRVIVQSMLPLYAAYYMHLSPTQVGMLFTISGVIVFVMIVPAGFLMDRVGRKWCTVPSTGIPALVFLLIPVTESFTPPRDSHRHRRSGARFIVGFFGHFNVRRRAGARARTLAGLAPHHRRTGQRRRASDRRLSWRIPSIPARRFCFMRRCWCFRRRCWR